MKENNQWWSEEYGFFGSFYMLGDNSREGYRVSEKQSLQERTDTEVDGIVRLLHLKKGSRILDVPCGYGRHSIALAKRGFVVVGSDINKKHLSVARKENKKNFSNVTFVKENMLNITYHSEFDAVVNMFYSFGFFESDEENFRVLKRLFNALKNDGQFLMHTDVNIPFIKTGRYKFDETRTLLDNQTVRIIDAYDPNTKRINGSWTLTDKKRKRTKKEYSVRVYTKEEFMKLCKKAGFKSCKAYSSWSGRPYSEESEDMIIIATK